MNKSINIAVVGLGQVGSYLLNELNTKKCLEMSNQWMNFRIE